MDELINALCQTINENGGEVWDEESSEDDTAIIYFIYRDADYKLVVGKEPPVDFEVPALTDELYEIILAEAGLRGFEIHDLTEVIY